MAQAKILFVDDEESVLSALKRCFRKEGYELYFTVNPEEGIEILKEKSIDLIVTDYRMPQMTGVDFLEKAIEIVPKTTRMILSGYADEKAVLDSINKGQVYKFLTKPWEDEVLKEEVRQALNTTSE